MRGTAKPSVLRPGSAVGDDILDIDSLKGIYRTRVLVSDVIEQIQGSPGGLDCHSGGDDIHTWAPWLAWLVVSRGVKQSKIKTDLHNT